MAEFCNFGLIFAPQGDLYLLAPNPFVHILQKSWVFWLVKEAGHIWVGWQRKLEVKLVTGGGRTGQWCLSLELKIKEDKVSFFQNSPGPSTLSASVVEQLV